jgi:pyruvate/2-oxoglutarate dehydrogenase complex dihydrolipoamide dehydrogenase (E3) component
MGGDCLNTGCVPSKSFLRGAHLLNDLTTASNLGLQVNDYIFAFDKLQQHVVNVIKSIEPHDSKERYESLGVTVIEGYGSIADNHSVKVNDQIITAKNIVIATGSSPFIPPIKGLETVKYYTNESIFTIEEQPKQLIVLGAGPIGTELGQAFQHIGSQVTLIDRMDGLFMKDDQEVGPLMRKVFEEDGINLKLSSAIEEIYEDDGTIYVKITHDGATEIIEGDALLVSLGRKANTSSLNLDSLNIKLNPRGSIITNKKLQTTVKNIYACGDVTGPFQFTHMAGYQAGIVLRNTIFKLGAKVNYDNIAWTTYTKPEIAHVGLTENMAIEQGVYHKHYLVDLKRMDRALADKDLKGFLKVIVNKKSQVIGATLVGNKSGEQIPIASMAVTKKMKLSAFMSVIYSYPTESEIFKFAALDAMKESLTPFKKTLIKKLFLK